MARAPISGASYGEGGRDELRRVRDGRVERRPQTGDR